MSHGIARTAEHVAAGHPDKFCDQVADRILDQVLEFGAEKPESLPTIRTAIECLAKDNLLIISGEVKLPERVRSRVDVVTLARHVWSELGYSDNPEDLTVIDHIRAQSVDIAHGAGTGTDAGGAGDQGVMVGYATSENEEMVPQEWLLARNLCRSLHDHRVEKTIPWLRADCKTQVSLDANGEVGSVIVAAQHTEEVGTEEIILTLMDRVVKPVVGDVPVDRVTINGTGRFVIGGPTGDAGVVGRKIVVDAYGPRVPVGGGAYSGKDPTKVDRSAAYMCRHIAKTIVAHGIGDAKECTVQVAYGIGKHQPEMVTAMTETGKDLSSWVHEHFADLSPTFIAEHLQLFQPQGWHYYDTAAYGHYGRPDFPWEKIADV
ncbi:MAG: methionine adenosyltransferase [Acidobacteriota bacterium]|nr:methionine adenosyltransferase [Acidobacteriota bacterium]